MLAGRSVKYQVLSCYFMFEVDVELVQLLPRSVKLLPTRHVEPVTDLFGACFSLLFLQIPT